MLMPCIYLLFDFAKNALRTAFKAYSFRSVVLLGIFAGCLPMIHTHSFLALALMSFGFMVYCFLHTANQKRFSQWKHWGIYAGIAGVLALPQLFLWTFGQTFQSEHFLRFQFNWVNNLGGNGLQDGYFWFYLKNVGLPFLLIIFALFEKNKRFRLLAYGAFSIFLVAECILFQPNEYDNNKLFYVWYMLCAMMVADYCIMLYDKIRGLRARPLIAVLCSVVFFLSGGLSIARELGSDFVIFSAEDVETATFVEENTKNDAVFMTGTQHVNPVSSLAGRTIVCGPGMWLYFHGFDLSERTNDIQAFYSNPRKNADIIEKYGISHILITPYEKSSMTVDSHALYEMYDVVFESGQGSNVILAVTD